jgi:hypothetical protein
MTATVLLLPDRVADLATGRVVGPAGLARLEDGPRRLLAWLAARRGTAEASIGVPTPWMVRLREVLETGGGAGPVVLGDPTAGWMLAPFEALVGTAAHRRARAAAVARAAPLLLREGGGDTVLRLVASLLPAGRTPDALSRAVLRIARARVVLGEDGALQRRAAADLEVAECEAGADPDAVALIWQLRGELALQLGDPDAAETWLQRAHGVAAVSGGPLQASAVLERMAAVAREQGAPHRALRLQRQAVEALDAGVHPGPAARALTELAWAEHCTGDSVAARRHLQEAWRLAPPRAVRLRGRIRGGLRALSCGAPVLPGEQRRATARSPTWHGASTTG